jgi:opacity protein-like surface antigen
MKKMLLAVVMVLVLAVPAIADAPITVIVDGKTLNTPGVLMNDTTYVPLRVVSESLGAKVEWDGRAIISTLGRPVINGDESQKAKVEAALQLLKEKDPADYEMVCRYVKVINITDEKKILGSALTYTAIDSGETFGGSICLTETLFNKNNDIYTASVIVHEATHLCNARNNIKSASKMDENIAFLQEIAVLRILGASQSLIDGTEATRLRVTR